METGTPNSNDIAALSVGRQSDGSVIVDGGTLLANGDVSVGRAGTGDLVVENDGCANVGLDGADSASSGLRKIGGQGYPTGTVLYVGGTGSMQVTTDGTVTSLLDVEVGHDGTSGDLSINSGGVVETSQQVLIGTSTTVAAGDTIISASGSATVVAAPTLEAGDGPVDVGSGGTLASAQGFDVGTGAGASGSVTVSGNQSLLSNTGKFVVGDAGLGNLSIQSDGTVITTPGTGLAGAIIANTTGASGSSVNVSDAGSDWQVGGALLVGNAGAGVLNITAGGSVSATSLDSGVLARSDANISVTGAASVLSITGQLTVGDQSSADLSIFSGATVTATDADIGLNAGANQTTPGGADVVDIAGTGSRRDINVNLNIGDAGTGALVMGAGTTLTVVNNLNIGASGALQQFGGVIDPNTLTNNGPNAGGGASLDVGRTLTNNGVYTAGPGEYTINVGTADVVGRANMYVGGTLQGTGSLVVGTTGFDGDLVLNAGTVASTQTVEFNSQSTSEILTLGTLTGFDALIGSFNTTSGIVVDGISIVSDSFSNGTLTLFGAGETELGTLRIGSGVDTSLLTVNAVGGIGAAPCLAAGTRIPTARGEVAVEAIGVGGQVRVLLGGGPMGDGPAPVIWVGRREVDCTRQKQPKKVWPVRVAAGAFGSGRPHSELFLSPGHAVYVEEVLIPVKYLFNGSTITQERVERVTYYHLELAEHDVLLAEGLPAESFLDMKDGSNYANRPGPVRLQPDFLARMWEAFGCARLIVTGPELEAARALVESFGQEQAAA